jgi:hypothetical protein
VTPAGTLVEAHAADAERERLRCMTRREQLRWAGNNLERGDRRARLAGGSSYPDAERLWWLSA